MNNSNNEYLMWLHSANQMAEEYDQISNALAHISQYSEIIFQTTGWKLITDSTFHISQTNWLQLVSGFKDPREITFFKSHWAPIFENRLDYFVDLSKEGLPLYETWFDDLYEDQSKYHWRRFTCYNSINDFILDIQEGDQKHINKCLFQGLSFMESIGNSTEIELKKIGRIN